MHPPAAVHLRPGLIKTSMVEDVKIPEVEAVKVLRSMGDPWGIPGPSMDGPGLATDNLKL